MKINFSFRVGLILNSFTLFTFLEKTTRKIFSSKSKHNLFKNSDCIQKKFEAQKNKNIQLK